ncbi:MULTISPECIES: EAL domain-containing protein [unclassified Devosia]|uniref:EAL domain-containing protein n=1 Tax=unclassified Devosia TaxID=196773 RepID=UPI00155377CD|nr:MULTISPECIES: EAL domain-containing protein [unclassified Devosia]
MLLGAMLAFVPIAAVDHLLDAYVRVKETDIAGRSVAAVTRSIETGVADALASLDRISAENRSTCTPTFLASIERAIEASFSLKQVLVENSDAVQYCAAFGRTVRYSPLSAALPTGEEGEAIRVVSMGDIALPALQISRSSGPERIVSVFVPLIGATTEGLERAIPAGGMIRVLLADGNPVATIGDPKPFEGRASADQFIFSQGFAGQLPIKVESAVPFATVRAGYADLDVSFTVIACLMSAAFLILAIHSVRHSRVSGFELERAIARGEMRPCYQPVINLRTGELVGCEVLCRWQKRSGEIVSPGAFIDYAESSGLAIPMTLSLMQQVKYDLGELCTLMPELKISINLFEGHFRDGSIVEDVQAIFGGSAVDFRQLVFEITERKPLGNSQQAHSVIAGLHALGARLAMDDAGTGHSNLAYLQTLGVDVIKIDRVFIDMIKPGTTNVPVLDGLIAMARDLECEIVAEGVETEAQALYLRAHGVLQAQGFIFSPALRAEAFKELALALHQATISRSRTPGLVADAA